MVKTLSTMEGWVSDLHPGLDIIETCRPIVKSVRKERLKPQSVLREVIESGSGLLGLIQDLPEDLSILLDRLKQGEVRVVIEPKGLGDIYDMMNQVVTRLTSAMIVAALIVGSSLIIHAKIPPLWNEVSILGLIGYLVAVFEGMRILITRIKRTDKN